MSSVTKAEAAVASVCASYPMTFQQQGLWFLAQTVPPPEQACFNLCYATRLEGRLDRRALVRSIKALVARHASLRTRIEVEDGELRQVVESPCEVELVFKDLTGVSDSSEAEQQACMEEAGSRFNLTGEPLASFTLLCLRDNRHTLICNTHHIISDGLSIDLLHRDLAALYKAHSSEADCMLRPLRFQHYDFAVWQQEQLRSGGLEAQERYWLKELAELPPPLCLPTDFERPARQSFRGGHYMLTLTPALARRLQIQSFRQRVPLASILLAAFALLLSKYSEQDALMIGTNFAGRQQPSDLSLSVGFFVNTVAVALNLNESHTWTELLRVVNGKMIAAHNNQDYPLPLLLRKLNPKREASRPTLFQVAFDVQTTSPHGTVWAGLQAQSSERLYTDTSMLDVLLYVTNTATEMSVRLEYCTDLFTKETAALMAENYRQILLQITAGEDLRLSEIRLPARRAGKLR